MGQSSSSSASAGLDEQPAEASNARRHAYSRSSSSSGLSSRAAGRLGQLARRSLSFPSSSLQAASAEELGGEGTPTRTARLSLFNKRSRRSHTRSSSAVEAADRESIASTSALDPPERLVRDDKQEESVGDRPPLRQSVSQVRLPNTEAALESPVAILPLPVAESLIPEPTPSIAAAEPTAGDSVHAAPPTPSDTSLQSAPARRIVVTGTVSTLPRPVPTPVPMTTAANQAGPSTVASQAADATSTAGPSTPVSTDDATTNEGSSSDASNPSSDSASTPRTGSDGHAEQAVLISRLLSVAAAATAASLLPGRIRLNGQLIEGFPTANGSAVTSTAPMGVSSDSTPSTPASRSGSWRERFRRGQRSPLASPAFATTPLPEPSATEQSLRSSSAPPPSPVVSPLSPLQSILRQALAAEFGAHAPEVRRSDEAENPSRPTTPPVEAEASETDPSSAAPASPPIVTATASAATFVLASPATSQAGRPSSEAAEGSFERFLWDLQSDVSLAILRALREAAEAPPEPCDEEFLLMSRSASAVVSRNSRRASRAAPSVTPQQPAFSFFRSYRWPDHQLDQSGSLVASPAPSPSAERNEGSSTEASSTDVRPEQAEQPAATSSDAAAATAEPVPVAPILLVGVRTVDINLPLPGTEGASSGSQRSWMIWIAGGVYPTNHPLLAFPALLSGFDSAASYEDLLRLAEIMGGQHKPPVATQADIDASDLRVVNGTELKAMVEAGDVHINCSERCLICLEDYEEEHLARVLGCKHAFHRDCVDKWLAASNNNCPCCRAQGVATTTAPETAPTEPNTTA